LSRSAAPPTTAVLLRAVDYRDADRILTFYSRDRGRVAAIARGARRSRKRFGGALEPFCVVDLVFSEGRGDLATLKEATVTRAFPGVLTSLAGMREGGAALDLVRRITREDDAEPRLFDDVVALFEALGERERSPEDLRIAFTIRALGLVGMAPELEVCALSGVRCPPGQSAFFDPARGAIVRQALGGRGVLVSGPARASMIHAQGSDWATARFDERQRDDARRLLSAFLAAQLP